VRAGDSLWGIARRFGVTVEALCRWNGLEPDSVLRPGQELLIRRGLPAT
jgi:LysM repeat protein